MIDVRSLRAWSEVVPWQDPIKVEQDLVLSRAVVDLFKQERIAESCTLRGGTALNKLVFRPQVRYSEDIDLVQEIPGPIGPLLDAVREAISPWLGRPKVERLNRGTTLIWKFEATITPVQNTRLKLEINTREHGWVGHPIKSPLRVECFPWYSGETSVMTVGLEALLATKVRALYQRRKGRDLFDLHVCIRRFPDLDLERVLAGFKIVMEKAGHPVSWKEFQQNVQQKLENPRFAADIQPLLAEGTFEPVEAWDAIAPRLEAAWPDR